jgi:hypothetical protein
MSLDASGSMNVQVKDNAKPMTWPEQIMIWLLEEEDRRGLGMILPKKPEAEASDEAKSSEEASRATIFDPG